VRSVFEFGTQEKKAQPDFISSVPEFQIDSCRDRLPEMDDDRETEPLARAVFALAF
jgi:hypothetical protein